MDEINRRLILLDRLDEIVTQLKEADGNTTVIESIPETWMNHADYAKLLGIGTAALSDRIRKGYYRTPVGRLRPCYYLCAKNNSACFSVRLANEYYQLNTQKENTNH